MGSTHMKSSERVLGFTGLSGCAVSTNQMQSHWHRGGGQSFQSFVQFLPIVFCCYEMDCRCMSSSITCVQLF